MLNNHQNQFTLEMTFSKFDKYYIKTIVSAVYLLITMSMVFSVQ